MNEVALPRPAKVNKKLQILKDNFSHNLKDALQALYDGLLRINSCPNNQPLVKVP